MSTLVSGKTVIINGGVFAQYTINGPTGLDTLLKATSSGASHDSAERYPPPRCHPETRRSIVNLILEWIGDEERPNPILWLHGAAGVGKSAIAQTVAEGCQARGQLCGSYFFSRIGINRNHSRNLFPTLAYHMSRSVQSTAPLLEEVIRNNPDIVSKSVEVQFQRLIVEPLLQVKTQLKDPLVFIIDGLDECNGEDDQCQLIDIISAAAETLPVCFLISSRPETWITDCFDDPTILHTTTRYELTHSADVDNDIRSYLRSEFQRIEGSRRHRRTMARVARPWPGEAIIEVLVLRAQGQFVYVATIIRFVDDPYRRPHEQLEIVLNPRADHGGPDNPMQEIDKLYFHILSTCQNPDVMLPFLWTLCVILLHAYTHYKVQFEFLQRLQSSDHLLTLIEQILGLKEGGASLALRDLQSLLYTPESKSRGLMEEIRFFHISFLDFLQARKRSDKYFLDQVKLHTDMTASCLRIMTAPPVTLAPEDYFGWVYSIYHWDYHLRRSSPTEELFTSIQQFDIKTNWIDVLLGASNARSLPPTILQNARDAFNMDPTDHSPSHLSVLPDFAANMETGFWAPWKRVQAVHSEWMRVLYSDLRNRLARIPDPGRVRLALCMGGSVPMSEDLIQVALGIPQRIRVLAAPIAPFLSKEPMFFTLGGVLSDLFSNEKLAGTWYLQDTELMKTALLKLLNVIDDADSLSRPHAYAYRTRLTQLLNVLPHDVEVQQSLELNRDALRDIEDEALDNAVDRYLGAVPPQELTISVNDP